MAVSMQDDSMNVPHLVIGQPQIFLCEVQKQGSLSRLQWRIDFGSSPPVTRITRRFTTDNPEGVILRDSRPGVSFEFNLTSNSNSSSSLNSVMTVTVDDINGIASINNATVNCEGDKAYPIMLQDKYEGISPYLIFSFPVPISSWKIRVWARDYLFDLLSMML